MFALPRAAVLEQTTTRRAISGTDASCEAGQCSANRSLDDAGMASGDASAAPLGSAKNFVGRPPPEESPDNRVSRFKIQRFSATLTDHKGLSSCFWLVAYGSRGAEVKGVPVAGGYDRTRLGGLAVCGSHLCPVCGPRIAARRTDEVKAVLSKASGEGLHPVMLTLTARHEHGDDLAGLLDAMKSGLRRWKQTRAYKSVKDSIAGTVSATETTHGASGWHPHFHLILLVRAASQREALRTVARLRAPWESALRSEGRECGRAGFRATVAESAAAYVAKWDAAPEVAKGEGKKARAGGRTPTQLLHDAYHGDRRAAALWSEYAGAMKGKSVLRFSPGLKAWAGLEDATDEEAAEPDDSEEEAVEVIHRVLSETWQLARRGGLCRDRLLREARAGPEAVVSYVDECVLAAPPPLPAQRPDIAAASRRPEKTNQQRRGGDAERRANDAGKPVQPERSAGSA